MDRSAQRPLELILARNLLSSLSTPGFLVNRPGEMIFYNEAAGALLGVGFTAACRLWYGPMPLLPTLACGLACGLAHGVMDAVTWGRGAMLLWPFTSERIAGPPLFFGVHRSQPDAWHLHITTIVTELIFLAAIWWAARRLSRVPAAS